jgi:hypothetical protein
MARKGGSFTFLVVAVLALGAGFPVDRRTTHGDRLDLKDLWGSDGEVVRVVWMSTAGAVIESTIQASRGNGIDVSEDTPNRQIFFTPSALASIRAAQARTPCPLP